MAVVHQFSPALTNLLTIPLVPNPTGGGSQGYLKEVTGSLAPAAAASADSTLRFVRVPTNAKVKRVRITSQVQGAGKVDVGVYYPTDGKTAVADLAANAIDQDFFATVVDLTSAVQPTDITNESGTYTADLWNKPLWQAVGLSADPGGEFDIVATVKTTDITTGTGIIGLSVEFVE